MLHFGWDLDGVCFDWQYFVDWHNSVYGTNFTKEEFLNVDFPERFGVPLNELECRIDRMYKTVGIRNLLPASGAVSAMRTMAKIGKNSVVTSRPPWAHDDTMHWLRANFTRAITGEVYFTRNHHALSATSHRLTKSEVCVREGISYLFEDDPLHAVPAADAGVRVMLFDYHGNSLEPHENIYRVYSFSQAIEKVRELEKREWQGK